MYNVHVYYKLTAQRMIAGDEEAAPRGWGGYPGRGDG